MKDVWNWAKGKKTYIVAAGGIIGAWWGVYTGVASPSEAIQATYEGVMAMTIRHGVSTQLAS